MPIIENWSVSEDDSDEFSEPELRRKVLQGNIYGDDRFEDGSPVITSCIIELNIANRHVRTKNTTYTLGEPNQQYKQEFTECFK